MEFLKKHWMKIVACLFVALFFGMCSSNCSNKNKVRQLNNTVETYDSVKCSLLDSISTLNKDIDSLNAIIDKQNMKIDLVSKSNTDLNQALNRKVVVNIKQE